MAEEKSVVVSGGSPPVESKPEGGATAPSTTSADKARAAIEAAHEERLEQEIGGETPEPKGAEPKAAEKPLEIPKAKDPEAKPEDVPALKAELDRLKTEFQKRMDEKTAEIHRLSQEAKKDPEKPKTPSLSELPEDQLEAAIIAARDRKYYASKDPETGENVPGDASANLRIERMAMQELARRATVAADEPRRKEAEVNEAHTKSWMEAQRDFAKYLFTKNDKGETVLDAESPVVKRASELFNKWKEDPKVKDLPDLPRQAVERAIGQVSATADSEMLRKIHKLEMENERLKGLSRVDTGKGVGAKPEKPKDEDDDSPEAEVRRRKDDNRRQRAPLAASR